MADKAVGQTKPGRGLRIALGLSLALNLAVVGVVAGAMMRDGPGMRAAMVRDLGFGPYTQALTADNRKALRRALFDRAPEMREARQSRREDMQRLLTQLRAEPFDAGAFAQTMAEQEARMLRQLQLGQEVLQELVLAMSPEDRRGFADRLEAGLRGDRSKEARGQGD